MFKKKFIFSLVACFALSSCDWFLKKPDNKEQSQKIENRRFYGSLVEGSGYTGFEFSVSEKEIKKPKNGSAKIDIIGFNDFHGAINETESEMGLKRIGTFFKENSKNANTLILDQGDTWQGSFESNYSYGEIIQDVFYEAGVTLRTIGNHDFDWGTSKLESLCDITKANYIPTLGANIYDYKNGNIGQNQQTQYGKEYATFILESGVKIGVVGVIGDSETESISSQIIENIAFSNQNEKIKEISDFLRVRKKCDIVVASVHDYASKNLRQGLTDISSVSGQRYVDLVLNGHSHSASIARENNVAFVQWDSNGADLGKVSLEFDFSTGEILDNKTTISTFDSHSLPVKSNQIDPKINQIVDSKLQAITEIGKEKLHSNFQNYWDSESLGNLMAEAIYNEVSDSGEQIDFAVCNYARSDFNKNEMLYTDLYKCFPFDNQIILMDITGSTAVGSILSNFSYREDTSTKLSPIKTFRIAIIDYLGLHQNSNREYDYFPDCSNVSVFKNKNGDEPIYRELLANYLRSSQNITFDSSVYNSYNMHFRVN